MKHDEHFLSRLARLDKEHAEIALGLYYDSALVKHILRAADIADDTDRVALCLGAPEQGPHLIVARNGHFVTCLGEGMLLQEGQPVISRHRLDKISESVSSLRSLVADARAGNRKQTRRKLQRAFQAGSGLSQQEFEELAPWLPLLAPNFLMSLIDAFELCGRLVEHLDRRKLRRRDDELLHEYWRSAWQVAHLTMLLGSDGGTVVRKMLEVLEQDTPGVAQQLAWSLVRLGVTSFAARGAWIGSKLPAMVVPIAKRRYLDEQATFLTSLTDGLSLAAVGLRHRKYNAEVGKVLARGAPPLPERPTPTEVVRHYANHYFNVHTTDPQPYLQHTIDLSRQLVRGMYQGRPEQEIEALDLLPSDIPVAMFLTVPMNVHESTNGPRAVFEWLPWIVSVDAKAFYLPEPLVGWVRGPWQRADGLLLLEARRDGGVLRPQPVVAPPKIGRNEPCPCGSGKKYKRCCGAPGSSD